MRKYIDQIKTLAEEIERLGGDADPDYDAEVALERQVRAFCEQELGWEFDVSFAVVVLDGEITIKPAGEVTLEALEKLKALGSDIVVTAQNYHVGITIKYHPGLSVDRS